MWLALVFYCVTPSVDSCYLMANVNNLHVSEEKCYEDATAMANSIIARGVYARSACFKVGESV